MLDDLKDEVIKSLTPSLKAGTKWKISDTIRREGLGTNEKQRWSKTIGKI